MQSRAAEHQVLYPLYERAYGSCSKIGYIHLIAPTFVRPLDYECSFFFFFFLLPSQFVDIDKIDTATNISCDLDNSGVSG